MNIYTKIGTMNTTTAMPLAIKPIRAPNQLSIAPTKRLPIGVEPATISE